MLNGKVVVYIVNSRHPSQGRTTARTEASTDAKRDLRNCRRHGSPGDLQLHGRPRILDRRQPTGERWPPVTRCTVGRLMRALGLRGAVAGDHKKPVTTIPAADHRPEDALTRDFSAPAPNTRGVADIVCHEALLNRVEVERPARPCCRSSAVNLRAARSSGGGAGIAALTTTRRTRTAKWCGLG